MASPAPPLPSRLPAWLGALAIFVLAFVAFWPSVAGGVLWDDPAHLTIPALQSWSGFWRILTSIGVTQEYYPGLHGAFWIEHKLWGDFLPAYHLLNIGLHAASACLLAFALRRMATSPADRPASELATFWLPPGAEWLAAALFVVHPVTVESVAWMTEQKNTLSLFFYLGAGLLYLRFDDRRGVGDYVLGTIVFLLALAAKTATFTLPPALLVIAWWRRGRIGWRRDVLPLLPWFALSVAAGLVTVQVETNYVGAKGAAYALTFGQRLLLAPRILWFYVGKDLWPRHLLFFYPRWDVPAHAASWWPYLAAAGVVTAALGVLSRRWRGPLAGWLLFLGAMFPVLGFFNVFAFLFSYVADHFQYMPCLTFVAAVACTVAAAAQGGPRWLRRSLAGVGGVIVALLAMQTHRLSALYGSNETLFRHVIAENPDSWMAHQILGSALAKAGRDAEAIAQFREVMRLKPDHADAYLGLGVILAKQPGGKAEAISLYETALRLREHYVEAHFALGVALSDDPARRAEAIEHLEVAAGLQPYFAPAQTALGALLAQDRSRLGEALTHYRTALQYHPESAAVHRGYADALARAGSLDTALAEYNAALRLDPNDAIAHFHLGDVLAHTRRLSEASTEYAKALKLDPNLTAARLHYAALLAQQPDGRDEALREVETAVRLNPNDADAHNTLGIIAIQRGDATRARAEWEAALRVNPSDRDARANLQRLEAQGR